MFYVVKISISHSIIEFELIFFIIIYVFLKKKRIALAVKTVAALQGWNIPMTVQVDQNQLLVRVSLTFTRSATVKAFTMFIIFATWSLSLSLFAVVVDVYVRQRKIKPPILSVAIAMVKKKIS